MSCKSASLASPGGIATLDEQERLSDLLAERAAATRALAQQKSINWPSLGWQQSWRCLRSAGVAGHDRTARSAGDSEEEEGLHETAPLADNNATFPKALLAACAEACKIP